MNGCSHKSVHDELLQPQVSFQIAAPEVQLKRACTPNNKQPTQN
jgi:hypothetical protein